MFGLAVGFLLVLISGVSAYQLDRIYYDDYDNYDYGLRVRIGQDSGLYYYDYPRNYRQGYYEDRYDYGWHYGRDDDWEYKWELTKAIWDVSEAYDDWQYNIRGRSSGDVYGYGESDRASDWDNKDAYVISSPWREKDYYGEPRWDSEGGYFNWRY